jgi:ABC-2 type transport system permease protein
MLAIVRKELADSFNSARFFILFMLMLLGSGWVLYSVQQNIQAAIQENMAIVNNGFVFLLLYSPLANFGYAMLTPLSLIVPIIGIAMGFDAINSERTGRTMSRLLAQPVYRDGVINGKFIAGLIVMALMVGTSIFLIAGFGIKMIGVEPTEQEIFRLFMYFVITVVYGAFWMGLAMLCSVLFRRAAGSLLVPIALFLLVFIFWMGMGLGPTIANVIAPADSTSSLAAQIRNLEMQQTLLRLSPSYLYQEAFYVLLNPIPMGLGVVTYADAAFMVGNPLSMGQSLLTIWPHIVGLISLSVVFFAISYIVFMRQEVRST